MAKCLSPISLYRPEIKSCIEVPCYHCINCKKRRAFEWSLRLIMESHDWKDVCHVTLTYDDDHIPAGRVLVKKHIQNFIKRVRKNLDYKIKYFVAAEYGGLTARPHYHIVFFGLPCNKRTELLIRRCWSFGRIITVTPFFHETGYYVASYVVKKLYGVKFYDVPEFNLQSQKLGFHYFFNVLLPAGAVDLSSGLMNYKGFHYAIPRTFRRYLVDRGLMVKTTTDFLKFSQSLDKKLLFSELNQKNIFLDDYENFRLSVAQKS